MSLSKVIYTKDWNDPSDFPTIETSESQVRADLQDLHDQIRTSVNLIIDELESTNAEYSGASQVGVSPIAGISATNVQAAIAALKALIGEAESTASEDLSEHTTDKGNPHQVSGDQVPVSVEGITATKVEAALAEIKSLLDQKAESSDLGDYETVASANSHFVDVSLDVDTGVITFTKQNGSTKAIDTALETIPVSMRFFEVTTETGSKAYYLGIYDDDDKLLSSTNVSSLFNEFEISDTATIDMSQTIDNDGVKTISCTLKTASVGESNLNASLKQKLENLEGLLTTAVTGVQDSEQIALSLSNATTGRKLQATIKAKSIGAEQISDDYTALLTAAKTAAQTAATNAAASESNANTYQGKAKSYAVGDETAREGSSTDNASYYKDKAAEKATESKSYAVGGTGSRTNENTDNAKYYKEQAEAAKVSATNANSSATQKAEDANTQATLSKSYAQGGTGTRAGEDTNNAKYYMEQAAGIVSEAGLGDMLRATYDPQGKAQDIFAYADPFIAVYGETTYAEVEEACKAGKTVWCRDQLQIFPLVFQTQFQFQFSGVIGGSIGPRMLIKTLTDKPTKWDKLAYTLPPIVTADDAGKVLTVSESGIWKAAELAKEYTATTTTTWTDATGYYTQSVTVTGLLEADNPIVDLITTTENFEAEQEAWGKVFKVTTATDSITFYASEAITTELNLQIKVVR